MEGCFAGHQPRIPQSEMTPLAYLSLFSFLQYFINQFSNAFVIHTNREEPRGVGVCGSGGRKPLKTSSGCCQWICWRPHPVCVRTFTNWPYLLLLLLLLPQEGRTSTSSVGVLDLSAHFYKGFTIYWVCPRSHSLVHSHPENTEIYLPLDEYVWSTDGNWPIRF